MTTWSLKRPRRSMHYSIVKELPPLTPIDPTTLRLSPLRDLYASAQHLRHRDYHRAMPPSSHEPWRQLFWLLILAIPIATVARTVVFEEVFREPREWCRDRSQSCNRLLQRKFFYLFTCEYCFSHYVTIFFLILTGFKLLIDDWRGYLISWFALVLIANLYLNIYARLRVDISSEKKRIEKLEADIEATRANVAVAGEDPRD